MKWLPVLQGVLDLLCRHFGKRTFEDRGHMSGKVGPRSTQRVGAGTNDEMLPCHSPANAVMTRFCLAAGHVARARFLSFPLRDLPLAEG